MLEYVKTILLKVSFDIRLFEKELRKAFKVLVKQDLVLLRAWCYEQFASGICHHIVKRVFTKAAF
ncbi:hypothetical protein [Adhaeribacter aquaticus]|uniref:hypothetical protein n=1 Tax=Adhaeribacter aquaticus TaxID=299567 RepID=UPI000402FD12|nr:hypothetical protein [Adhaeribacter aquaticus]